jgi:low temperature requirement protein LtrA
MQLGRSLYMLAVVWPDPGRRSTYVRINCYFLASSVFWIWGGLTHDHDLRLTLWLIALGLDFLGPILGYLVPGLGQDQSTNWQISGAHMAERCGLFVIICLGETLLVSGATFAEMDWTGIGLLAFLSSVLGTGAMWWVYFYIGHRRGAHQIEHATDSGAIGRRSFTYYHIPIVAGIILGAVGAERAIAHPAHLASLAEGASIIGGLALFLFGNGLFKKASAEWFPLSHWVGLGLCALTFAAGPWMTLLTQNVLAAAILIVVAIWEHRSLSVKA